MIYSKNGLHLTEQFEGLRLTAYPDPGTGGAPWTIGYGHTGPDVHPGLTITQQQAENLLAKDIQTASDAVNRLVTFPINQNEFDALVDFTFNCGVGNLKASTLLKKVNAGDIADASKEFAKWNLANGHVLQGLVKRRQEEMCLFLQSINA
jgi:lysozyme